MVVVVGSVVATPTVVMAVVDVFVNSFTGTVVVAVMTVVTYVSSVSGDGQAEDFACRRI